MSNYFFPENHIFPPDCTLKMEYNLYSPEWKDYELIIIIQSQRDRERTREKETARTEKKKKECL